MRLIKTLSTVLAVALGIFTTLMLVAALYLQNSGRRHLLPQPLDVGTTVLAILTITFTLCGAYCLVKNSKRVLLFFSLSLLSYAVGAAYSVMLQRGVNVFVVVEKEYYASIAMRLAIFIPGIYAMYRVIATNKSNNNAPPAPDVKSSAGF